MLLVIGTCIEITTGYIFVSGHFYKICEGGTWAASGGRTQRGARWYGMAVAA